MQIGGDYMSDISKVHVTFETRENMEGVTIIESVISFNESDEEIDNYQYMVGKEFFGDDSESDAKDYIADELNIDKDIIETDNDFTETPWDN